MTRRRRAPRAAAGALTLAALALAALALPAGPPGWAADPDTMPGPRVMLCLYGADGTILAGSADCPPRVRPEDAMLADAHCFYDTKGRLWRGLPRCPRTAPAFLMDEADSQR
ncbi:hypothetical protein [Roseospira goensis]|uniref:Uncharacterized protein n=1 Tax=Roseospira goensis TaxID=391922 RepID=A0A7W6RZ62_9PROT|nr:hypothetical protein [Roseospira goensis]MBB4285746.1 hypothetical protein [Roseospira goensis]